MLYRRLHDGTTCIFSMSATPLLRKLCRSLVFNEEQFRVSKIAAYQDPDTFPIPIPASVTTLFPHGLAIL